MQPCAAGELPAALAGYCAPHVFVQDLAVQAGLGGGRELVHQAAALDRHTASVLGLDGIRALVDDLFAAHGDALPAHLRAGSRVAVAA